MLNGVRVLFRLGGDRCDLDTVRDKEAAVETETEGTNQVASGRRRICAFRLRQEFRRSRFRQSSLGARYKSSAYLQRGPDTNQVVGELLGGHADSRICSKYLREHELNPISTLVLLPAMIRRAPFSSVSDLIVMLRGLDPSQIVRSVNAVSRSFSNASFAFEISSRKKISLDCTLITGWLGNIVDTH